MGINQQIFKSISFKEVVQRIKAVVKKIRTSDSETNKKVKKLQQASKNFCDSFCDLVIRSTRSCSLSSNLVFL